MKFVIKNTKDVANDGVKMLLFAVSGFGKTTTLGRLEGKTLILSAESGLLVLKDKDVDVIDIDSIDTLGQVYLSLKSGELKYDNVCLDSLSEIGEMIVAELDKDEYYGDPTNTFPMWKEYTKRMINMCKKFRDLKGINIILIALSEPVEANGSIRYMPMIPAKKAQSRLVSLYDEVYYGSIDKDENRIINTSSSSIYDAKSRAGVKDKQILTHIEDREVLPSDITLGSILKQIQNKSVVSE